MGSLFQTPEEFCLGGGTQRVCEEFFDVVNFPLPSETEDSLFAPRNPQDIVLFVGLLGAENSAFFWKHLNPLGYERSTSLCSPRQ
jgi:bifunctional polynucleotide phosphatase/kinase